MVSKASLSICLGIEKSNLEKEFIPRKDVLNDRVGFKELSKWLKKVSKPEDFPIIVMEATGVYHEGIASYLYDLGYQVSILQSGRVKKYSPPQN